jgi:hypothetical protein
MNKSLKIPGLETHDIKLFLKVSEPTRQKDLRPVASLNSIPKRMLKIIFQQIKNDKPEIFYAKNDYSGPQRGSDLAVFQTYENMEKQFYGVRGVENKKLCTTLRLWDKSNAFNTFDRREMISKLDIGGNARKLITNAVVSQSSFSVRSRHMRSTAFELRTGGPQGQCGTGELFSTITKNLNPPSSFNSLTDSSVVKVNRIEYVDDTSDCTTALHKDIQLVHQQTETKLAQDCKKFGLKLNSEKTKTMVVGGPFESEKFLGYHINNKMTAESEVPFFLKRLESITNATRASTFLTRKDKMTISRSQIHSQLWTLVFLYVYLSETKFDKIRIKINQCFKKASNLLMRTPSEMIENFIYGMSFKQYVLVRFDSVVNRFKRCESKIFDGVIIGRLGEMRRNTKVGCGKFVNLYIKNYNLSFDFKNINNVQKKRVIKELNRSKIINFQTTFKNFLNNVEK